MFWLFGHKSCGILSPQPEVEPTPSALEGKLPVLKNYLLDSSRLFELNTVFQPLTPEEYGV